MMFEVIAGSKMWLVEQLGILADIAYHMVSMQPVSLCQPCTTNIK